MKDKINIFADKTSSSYLTVSYRTKSNQVTFDILLIRKSFIGRLKAGLGYIFGKEAGGFYKKFNLDVKEREKMLNIIKQLKR